MDRRGVTNLPSFRRSVRSRLGFAARGRSLGRRCDGGELPHALLGHLRINRQADGYAPTTVGVGHQLPMRHDGDRLVDQLKSTFGLADRFDRVGPRPTWVARILGRRRCRANRRPGRDGSSRVDRAGGPVGRAGLPLASRKKRSSAPEGKPAKLNSGGEMKLLVAGQILH